MALNDFRETLERLGLSQYHDGLLNEAFDSWEVLADITEEDMDALGVKLGHRRVLQRAIAQYRRDGQRSLAVVDTILNPDGRTSTDATLTTDDKTSGNHVTSRAITGGKRKYRRHPKSDENAPDRPPSAYVLFSNQVRETLKGQDYSFTEIAKTVGERWQVLPPDDKATYESRSQAMKDRYYARLAEYKKTQDYADYQKYLADFKAKHDGKKDNKRKREGSDQSLPRRPSDERGTSSPDNKTDSTHESDLQGPERKRSLLSPRNGFTRLDWKPTHTNHNPPPVESHHFNAPSPSFSPRNNRTTFASINAPPSHSPNHGAHFQTGEHSAPPRRNEHPMASSTNLAYGYTSLAPQQSSSSSSMSPPLLDHNRLNQSEPSAFASLLNGPRSSSYTSIRAGLTNRQLPPLFPSRPQNGGQGTSMALKSPVAAESWHQQAHQHQHMQQQAQQTQSSGIASLLRAGEHLASSASQSPPLAVKKAADGVASLHREARPP